MKNVKQFLINWIVFLAMPFLIIPLGLMMIVEDKETRAVMLKGEGSLWDLQ